jgi:hypothetical protein
MLYILLIQRLNINKNITTWPVNEITQEEYTKINLMRKRKL